MTSVIRVDDRQQNETDLQDVLQRIASYSHQRGVDIISTMEQFDRQKMGKITESQFYRAFVGPVLNDADVTLLRDRYGDSEKPGLISYLHFAHDIQALAQKKNRASSQSEFANAPSNPMIQFSETVIDSDHLLLQARSSVSHLA
jgi:hypothetical protein